MATLRVDNEKDFRALRGALDILEKDGFPNAVSEALNTSARLLEGTAQRFAKQRLTIRTKFSINGIKQDRHAKGRNIEAMFSRVQVRSDYMVRQNFGGTVRAKGQTLAIATAFGRGGSNGKKIPRKYAINKLMAAADDPGSPVFTGAPFPGAGPGIWVRKSGKPRLLRRFGFSSVNVPATRFYTDAARKFGNRETVVKAFERIANQRINQRFNRGR